VKLRAVSLFVFLVALNSNSPTIAQGVPHLEQCTLTKAWNIEDGWFGVKNICDKSIMIQFMSEDSQKPKSAELRPGDRFNTGLHKVSGWWVFTTCPAGYVSSIPFDIKYKAALTDGVYNCIKK
jgi:hypothetical protein